MVVAVLSDTHNLLRQEVVSQIQSCDAVIHAGDISSQKIIDQILECRKKDAPFYVVRGNNDKEWAEDIPEFMNVTLAGDAVKMAVESPLLETTISGATHVIINVSGDITLSDAADAADYVQNLAGL